ncbi:cytochrome c oxidase subunit 2A [Pseudogracilibacillus sp. SO30301A]|uniref:cytochrome c oxidase subunit 2A n=1 Tax=Pseudogracilibacillus sp. SO30301A TaxID=3098291 RepID=UPI00300DEFA3
MALKLKERPVEVNGKKGQVEPEKHEDINLGGSLVSVIFLGLIIIVSWLGVWTLFIIR